MEQSRIHNICRKFVNIKIRKKFSKNIRMQSLGWLKTVLLLIFWLMIFFLLFNYNFIYFLYVLHMAINKSLCNGFYFMLFMRLILKLFGQRFLILILFLLLIITFVYICIINYCIFIISKKNILKILNSCFVNVSL